MINQRSQLALKVEATEGVAVVPAAADCILCEDLGFNPDVQVHERNPMRSTLSRPLAIVGRRAGEITGKTEVKGSGTKGTAPDISPLMKALGCKETIVADTSVAYTPIDGDPNLQLSYTAQMLRDGKVFSLAGARGTGKLIAELGNPLYVQFGLKGAWTDLDDVAMFDDSAVYDAVNPVAFIDPATKFSWNGYEPLISRFELDFGVKLGMRPDVNSATGVRSFRITGRDPKGSMDAEEEAKAVMDWFAAIMEQTEGLLTFAIGLQAGNIVTVSCPKTQLIGYSPADREGITATELALKFNMNAGNDEWSITLT